MIKTKISNSFYIPVGRLVEVPVVPPRAPLPLRASAVLWVLMTSSLVMVRRAFLTPKLPCLPKAQLMLTPTWRIGTVVAMFMVKSLVWVKALMDKSLPLSWLTALTLMLSRSSRKVLVRPTVPMLMPVFQPCRL